MQIFNRLYALVLTDCHFGAPPTTNSALPIGSFGVEREFMPIERLADTAESIWSRSKVKRPILISTLPFNIIAPGTYAVTANLACPVGQNGITINPSVSGPIVLDLNGYTLSTFGPQIPLIGISVHYSPRPINNGRLTIKNGTIAAFGAGVVATGSNIDIENIYFLDNQSVDIAFGEVNFSSVSNCRFNSDANAIQDLNSTGGNSYINNQFATYTHYEMYITSPYSLVLEDCRFGAPAN